MAGWTHDDVSAAVSWGLSMHLPQVLPEAPHLWVRAFAASAIDQGNSTTLIQSCISSILHCFILHLIHPWKAGRSGEVLDALVPGGVRTG
ncbi:hypothetical protein E4U36_005070 [Claviceps purpurea]|nr:hypothetical protein E4U36_005070 [Claviceps purpurea]